LLTLLAVVLLASSSVVLSGCSNFFQGTTRLNASYDATASTDSTYSVNVTASSSGTGLGFCITAINYQWSNEATVHAGWASPGLPHCLLTVHRVLTIPARVGGGTLRVHVVALDSVPLWPDRDDTWSAPIVIPAATPTAFSAVLFAQQSPAGTNSTHSTVADGTLVDARQSTGTGTLSYQWSNGCDNIALLPAGMARVAAGWTGTCTVTVTDGGGHSGTASAVITKAELQNGFIAFPSGTTASIYASVGGGWVDKACVDLNGGTNYTEFSAFQGMDSSSGAAYGSVSLTALTPGLHRISAVLLMANSGISDSQACASATAITADKGYSQTVSALYRVAANGSVFDRRGDGRSARAFVAPSALRFVSIKTISEGTVNRIGAMVGATASGTFSWATPKTSKGIKRPAGAAALVKGTYVMRAISMSPGPKKGASSLLLGTGTVLLRGASGTLACGTIVGKFDSSTLTLAGGNGAARRLAGFVTGKPIGYVFPKSTKKPGKQPTKKPTKKPGKTKLTKAKPVKARGTANLQTAARPKALPAACKALVRYLPR